MAGQVLAKEGGIPMQRKHLLIGALIALPLLAGGGVAAVAASGSASGTSPAATFLADLASHLGISTSTLQSAVQQSEIDQVEAQLKAGKLTQAQATKIETQIKSGDVGRGFGMMGGPHGRRGFMAGGNAAMQAAATYLGLTQQQLMTDLQGGKSLSSLATASSGKSVSGLEAAITAAIQQSLQQAVSQGKLTQAQATTQESNLQTFVQQFVTRTGPPMRPNGDQGRGWGPPPGQQTPSGSSSTSN